MSSVLTIYEMISAHLICHLLVNLLDKKGARGQIDLSAESVYCSISVTIDLIIRIQ